MVRFEYKNNNNCKPEINNIIIKITISLGTPIRAC